MSYFHFRSHLHHYILLLLDIMVPTRPHSILLTSPVPLKPIRQQVFLINRRFWLEVASLRFVLREVRYTYLPLFRHNLVHSFFNLCRLSEHDFAFWDHLLLFTNLVIILRGLFALILGDVGSAGGVLGGWGEITGEFGTWVDGESVLGESGRGAAVVTWA